MNKTPRSRKKKRFNWLMLEKPVLFIASVSTALILTSMMACGELGHERNELPIQGSIKVEEGANLEALATITPEAAKVAALARYPGATAEEAELESEDGFLVYEVEIEQEGEEKDVLVDAGTGTILQADGEDLTEDDEGMEADDEHDEDGEMDDDDEMGEGDEDAEQAELPEAVEQAFRRAYPNAVIVGTDAETKDGTLFYEIESKDGEQPRDLLYRPDGTLYEFEEAVALDALPETVRDAAATQGSLVEAERITRGEVVAYEVRVTVDGKVKEVLLGADGQVIEAMSTSGQ